MKKVFALLILCASLLLPGAELLENPAHSYQYHLQGIAADETGIYWSFTDTLVKTDWQLKVLKEVRFPRCHGGDLCVAEGDIYWGMLLRKPDLIAANSNSKGAVYRFSKDLVLKKKYPLVSVKEGIDGITFHKGKFYAAPVLAKEPHKESAVVIFDRDFKFLKRMEFTTESDKKFGIQTLNMVHGTLLTAFYDNARYSPLFSPDTMKLQNTIELRPNVGMAKVPAVIAGNDNTFIIGRLRGKRGAYHCGFMKVIITPDFKVR